MARRKQDGTQRRVEQLRQSSRYLAVEVRFGRRVFLGAVYVPGLGKLPLVFHRTLVRFPALHLVRLVQLIYIYFFVGGSAGKKTRAGVQFT